LPKVPRKLQEGKTKTQTKIKKSDEEKSN